MKQQNLAWLISLVRYPKPLWFLPRLGGPSINYSLFPLYHFQTIHCLIYILDGHRILD